jgi:hypothetical protein
VRLATTALVCGLGACTSAEPGTVPWGELHNPVFAQPDAVKDAFAIYANNVWHLGYSELVETPFRFHLGLSRTTDWRHFATLPSLDDASLGGLASPDVVRAPDGRWVMTYNSHDHDLGTATSKLYYRTSTDLDGWSEGTRLHIDGIDAPEERLIDGALAFADAGAFLFFKRDQVAYVAYSPSGAIDVPFTPIGALATPQLENLQALRLDGVWHLLGTSIPFIHRPVLLRLDGDEHDPTAWARFTQVRELEVPAQSWNDDPTGVMSERANAGYLVDHRGVDGYYYLLYAGSAEIERFSGRGYSRLGLARSRDLVAWEPAVP